jgi:nucleotide-binding universal stress UspA family protein
VHKHILIPTDGSDLSYEAIQYATALAKAVNARVTGVTVSTPFHIFAVELDTIQDALESYRQRMTTVAAQRLDKVKEAAEAAGVDCEVVHVEHAHPYNAIIDIAKAKGCDLIVMASHGRRRISAIVLGSETVIRETHPRRCTAEHAVHFPQFIEQQLMTESAAEDLLETRAIARASGGYAR